MVFSLPFASTIQRSLRTRYGNSVKGQYSCHNRSTRKPANPALLRNGHRIFCYDGSSCCTDVRSGAWAVAADRFAREIVGFWQAFPGALAAAECQPVGRQPSVPTLDDCWYTECFRSSPYWTTPIHI